MFAPDQNETAHYQDLQCLLSRFDYFNKIHFEKNSFLNFVDIPCNYPQFLDKLVWANSADPDQTAPTGAPTGAV